MTKMQAIARTILTVLGIYAVVTLGRLYPGRYGSPTAEASAFGIALDVLFFLLFVIFVAFVGYAMIVRNGALARALADDEDDGQQVDASFLAKSLRIGLLLAGLMLLPGSVPFLMKVLTLPFVLRPMIDQWIISEGIPGFLKLSWSQWYTTGFEAFSAVLMVYLISGAPRLLRLQVRHSFGSDFNAIGTHDPEGRNCDE